MIEILSEIGEILFLGIGLLLLFTLLNAIFSSKSETNYKFLIPLVGGFFGVCIGVFLGNFFSDTWAIIGAVSLGVIGLILSISMSNQTQDL
jgi:hypothetical protein